MKDKKVKENKIVPLEMMKYRTFLIPKRLDIEMCVCCKRAEEMPSTLITRLLGDYLKTKGYYNDGK